MIIIPARLNSTRLPGKLLEDLHGDPVIVHTWRNACKAGPTVVATDSQAIADAISNRGGHVVMTGEHQSGTDRVHDAMHRLGTRDPVIVNVQGDMPIFNPQLIGQCASVLDDWPCDIATLVTSNCSSEEIDSPSTVKVLLSGVGYEYDNVRRILAFSRADVPWGPGALYKHIGIYAYRREALKKFVGKSRTALEQREDLEQMRAIEWGMSMLATRTRMPVYSVDTVDDLLRLRRDYHELISSL